MRHSRWLYLRYIGLALVIVWLLAFVQFIFVYGGALQPKLLVIPSVVAVILGGMLAYQRQLKNDNEWQKHQFASIVEMADEVAYLQTPSGEYSFIASSVEALTGYDPAFFYQRAHAFESLIVEEDRVKWNQYYHRAFKISEFERSKLGGVTIRLRHQNGELVWVKHHVKPIFEAGHLTLLSAMNINVTQQVEQEQALQTLAVTDQLTQLPNRRGLEQKVEALIQQGTPFYLVMMDLNRFKSINDSLGHSFGDQLLIEVAKRFQPLTEDDVTIARFGGDEFVFVVNGHALFLEVMKQIEGLLAKPMAINGFDIQLSGSFGYVHYPDDAADLETLVRYADAAMHQAKQVSGLYSLRYEGDSILLHEKSMFIERNLLSAIESKAIFPYFQPLFDAKGEQIVGVECLARWQDETYGWIAPDEFIHLAEATHLISQLGESILEQALQVAQKVQQQGTEIPFSVNISVRQLLEGDFCDRVFILLDRYGLKPACLKLEVTESLFLGETRQAITVLQNLRKMGVRISLDDFGTGYSALAVLKEVCLDQIKVDRSFVESLATSTQAQALFEYVVKMAHALDLEVVSEGVETEAQLALIQAMGSDVLQGYYLSRPLSAEDFMTRLQRRD